MSFPESTERLPGDSQLLRWRVAASFAWTIILLPFTCLAFITLSKIQVLHPIQWVTDTVSNLSSSSTFFCLLLLTLLLGIHCAFNVKFYTVVPSIPGSRLSLIGQILIPQHILHSLVYAVMGMLMSWCCAVLSKGQYQYLVLICTSEASQDEASGPSKCLDEHHVFLLLAGGFIGYTYSLTFFVHNMNYLSFPAIQQFRYLQFRRILPLLIKHSCVQSLYLLRTFAIIYFFLGYIPRTWILTVLNLKFDGLQPPLDTLRGLLNLSLFYQVWLSGTFLLTIWYMVWILFRIYATEACVFSVQSSFAEEADRCLPNVLSSDAPPIVKYLALQDLMLLSQYSPSRRQEVFSLSLPGGHPHNWAAISRECLKLLNGLTSRLVAHQEAAANNGRVRLSSSPVESRKPSSSSGGSVTENSPDQPPSLGSVPRLSIQSLLKTSNVKSPWNTRSPFVPPAVSRVAEVLDHNSPWHGSIQSPHIMRRGATLWTCDSDGQGTEAAVFSPVSHRAVRSEEQQNPIYTWCRYKQDQIKNFLAKRVLIMYLFSKHPEASSQEVFADAQIHIWALEGLSFLVAASFSEDRMGVVQTCLSDILCTFLNLQEAVEKHFKLPHASSKPARSSMSLVDSSYKTMRFALRAALKTAIYRITTTFGEHLHAVPVSAEHQKKLQQFLDFKE